MVSLDLQKENCKSRICSTKDLFYIMCMKDNHWSREWQTTQYSCLENPMNSMKSQKDRTVKDELPRSVGAQYATGGQWRNNYRKNEETEPKQNTQWWM